jgi:thiosulfate dehydrogenase [quinone] large subunit
MKTNKLILGLLRVSLAFVFLWAFFDKIFGLGFATEQAQSWINGGSPTTGFLGHAVKGPLADFFHSLSGMIVVDWLFMLGLLFVGLTLLFNKYIKWGALVGSIMLGLMYIALMAPANNPIIDEHIIYILVLAYLGVRADSWKQ